MRHQLVLGSVAFLDRDVAPLLVAVGKLETAKLEPETAKPAETLREVISYLGQYNNIKVLITQYVPIEPFQADSLSRKAFAAREN